MNGGKPRFHILDLVRGLAVFLMLLAHSVYFFHARDSSFLVGLENIGNLFCFVTFLIVSGATTYVSYLSHGEDKRYSKRILSRVLILLLSYYLIALFVEASSLASSAGLERLKIVIDILLFRNLPSYTEYIVPFIFYPLLMLPFGKHFLKIVKKPWIILGVAAASYLAGHLISLLPLPAVLVPWQALIAGHAGVYRFALLQYLPVFLLGLYWGTTLIGSKGLAPKKRLALKFTILAALLITALYYGGRYFGLTTDILFKRWPPSPGFLFLSSGLTFISVLIFYWFKRLNGLPIIRDFLLLIGQNAYSIFWAHIFLLTIYKFAGGELISSPWIFLFMFAVLWVLVFALAIILPFNLRLALNFHRFSREDEEEFWDHSQLMKFEQEVSLEGAREAKWFKRYFFPPHRTPRQKKIFHQRRIALIVLLSLIIAALLFPAALEEAKSVSKRSQTAPWWDDSFGYRQNLTIKNQSPLTDIKAGQTLTFEFDHKKLTDEHIAKLDGSDMRLLYWDDQNYASVPFGITDSWSQKDSRLVITARKDISGGKNDNGYFLYFGNFYCENAASAIKENPAGSEYAISPSKITTHALNLKVGKRWNLIGDTQPTELKITADSNIDLKQPELSYYILDSKISGKLKGDNGHYAATVPLSSLRPGRYQIQVIARENEKQYSSQKEWIFISYPLYVTWTQDWEGYDANSNYLQALTKISSQYSIPMTHFFNARIYDGSMSQQRADYLTAWLKDRLKEGDDLAFHLHMFYDLVTASGVVPKTEPRWDDTADGYSVLTTAYTKDELKQIINYSLSKFAENGLPKPTVYRAGGWFANTETLQAAAESGFVADSSGRTSYHFGKRNTTGPWNLAPTTQPYLPSASDQNTTSLSNHLNILEIPDNGADSYWFTADEMISRFKQNFSGEELSSKAQVTFLTHPHWFKDAEQQKIHTLFKYVSQYSNTSDSGPVVFTTSDKVYQAWTK